MNTITHPYFGLLSTTKLQDTDVIWEVPQDLNGKAIETWLWADPATSLDAALLDTFASTLGTLAQLDQKAREALALHLQTESDFIDNLAEAASEEGAQGLPTVQTLLQQARAAGREQIRASDFVAALQLEISGDGGCTAAAAAFHADAAGDGDVSGKFALRAVHRVVRGLQRGAVWRDGQQGRPHLELDAVGDFKHQRSRRAVVLPEVGAAEIMALHITGRRVLGHVLAKQAGQHQGLGQVATRCQ